MDLYLFRDLVYKKVTAAEFDSVPAERRVGTIGYTMIGVVLTCASLLIGAFGYNLAMNTIGNLLPKQLDALGASNTSIAFVLTALPSAVTVVCNPIFSFWSDRTRTRFGRRRPFLLMSAPVITLLLVAIGWAPLVANFITTELGWNAPWVPLVVLGTFATMYNIAFMFPGAIIWYLFPDVVPAHYIGRYFAVFNVVGTGAGFFFGSVLMKLSDNYMGWVYTGVAAFFLVTMLLLIFLVREGSYPPVQNQDASRNVAKAVKVYALECYSIPFYFFFYVAMALSDVSTVCRAMFNVLYAQKTLGLSSAAYGDILSIGAVVGLVLSIPCGWLSDRMHPMRFFALSLMTVILVNLFSFFLVKDEQTFLITSVMLAVVYTMQGVSTIPVFVEILPKAQYGQFSSANALFRSIFLALCGLGGGVLFDYLDDYQYIYAWDFIFTLASLVIFLFLYRSWMRRGGANGYVAPVYQWKKTLDNEPA